MEPNRLENEFKNKLEQRAIEPSAMAWDRLDAMLSVTEEKKQPKKRYWMYIAASFLGFLLIGALLLKMEGDTTNGSDVNTTTVVNTDEPLNNSKTDSTVEETEIEQNVNTIVQPLSNEAVAQHITPVENVKAERTVKHIQHEKHDTKIVQSVVKQEEAVAVQEVHQESQQETEELLATSLADDAKASKNKSKIKVDASSLLSSVEGELDNSFRSEVLQKVVKNYNTVKTSVANRNYQ